MTCGRNGASFHASMLLIVSVCSCLSRPVERLIRISSIFCTAVVWNGFTFQKRSGVGPSLSSFWRARRRFDLSPSSYSLWQCAQ